MGTATATERKQLQLHRLGDDPAVAVLTSTDGDPSASPPQQNIRRRCRAPWRLGEAIEAHPAQRGS
jgi:hypothetical protein